MGQYIGNTPFTQATRDVKNHPVAAGQTIFPVTYSAGMIDVVLNGAYLQTSEFTALDGLNIVLNDPTFAGDTLTTVSWATFAIAPVDAKLFTRSRKNLLINGDLSVTQRGTSELGRTSSGASIVDRWRLGVGGGSSVDSLLANLNNSDDRGNTYYAKRVFRIAIGATGTAFDIRQRIEPAIVQGSYGKPVTLSYLFRKAIGAGITNMAIHVRHWDINGISDDLVAVAEVPLTFSDLVWE